jgi:hypothetical protein
VQGATTEQSSCENCNNSNALCPAFAPCSAAETCIPISCTSGLAYPESECTDTATICVSAGSAYQCRLCDNDTNLC